ncbi:MAG: 23S rRNA (adenine(2030)-N(6))-methyltransferase RlmJ [Gammaproteobacteria bacterium]|nr:23S rRNA (adenine(2030)-N(6))-methyltransferase RlmJ [Gammaproteobacteria bacterium]
MLSYQHGYHAGNAADVHKHLILLATILRMQQKSSAIHYFDTHAGKGVYDLRDAQAQKTGEYLQGVQLALNARDELAQQPQWQQFFVALDAVQKSVKTPNTLEFYPGSPALVAGLTRDQDRHTVFELHPNEHQLLSTQAREHTGYVVYGDGLKGVLQQLPPKTPRLLALIDPAYENKDEYAAVAATVTKIMQRCRHAVVLVWYPLLPAARHEELLQALATDLQQPILQSEFHYKAKSGERGMYGSGMLVVNPPWQIEAEIEQLLAPLLSAYEPIYGAPATLQQTWLRTESD